MKKGNVDRAGKMLLGVLLASQDFHSLCTLVFHLLHLFNADSSLAKDFPKSALGKEAEERAKQLQDKGTEIKDFYTELNKLADSKK